MENKLTNIEIARVFAMYMNTEVTTNTGWTAGGLSASYPDVNVHNLDSIVTKIKCGEDIKLVLLPISSITDEHAIEVARLKKKNIWQETDADTPRTNKEMRNLGVGIVLSKSLCYEGFIFIIQQGYSAPLFFGINHWANGKTAIELGIAVDKTKNS